jgi:hypothetical protein
MSTGKKFFSNKLSDIHRGPHPGILAMVHVLLFMASLVLLGALTNGKGFPMPFASLEKSREALQKFADAIRLNAFLQFGAAIPLGIFTAAVTSRLSFLGVNVTGVRIALFGGFTASLLMTISSLCGWVLSQPGVADSTNIMHAIQLLGFSTGGVAHITALGLLMAGVSVPCLVNKYTPKWIAWLGIILAAVAELSTFSLVFQPATFLLPIARFGAYIWMIGTGFTLTKNKASIPA